MEVKTGIHDSERHSSDHHIVIAQIEPPQSHTTGDYYYRTYAPGVSMSSSEGIHFVDLTSLHRNIRRVMQNADVVILKNICDPDFLPLIMKRKSCSKLTIYEIADDMCHLQPWNPVYNFFRNIENQQLMKLIAHYCDGLQFTTKELEKLYVYLNLIKKVIPNQITIIPSEKPLQSGKKTLNIGWGGSHGHLEDLSKIEKLLLEWFLKTKNARFHLMCSDIIWKVFENIPSDKKVRYKPGSIYDYYDFLRNIDIGIAPLNDTPFNRSRSDVKYIEYAINEIVPIVQNMEPYKESVQHGKTGFLFKDGSNLIEILDGLIANREKVQLIGKQARKYVMQNRLQCNHNEERIIFYQEGMLRIDQKRGNNAEAEHFFEELTKMAGASQQERHITLEFSRYEHLLYDGLVRLQVEENNKDKSYEMFLEASSMEPDEYLPYLFGSGCSKNPERSLLEALKKNPLSIKSLILLGEIYMNINKYVESLECFQKAAELFPAYDIPFRRTALVLQRMGNIDEAGQFEQLAASMVLQ